MKINMDENNEMIFGEIYVPIHFVSNPKELPLSICMRDGGFEITYGDHVLSFKKGAIHFLYGDPDD
jgi:hypothetical protein